MSEFVQANTNGRLHDATEPSLSPLDRGFLYGDAVYEVWRTYGGVLFAVDEHWERLQSSARALHFAIEFSREQLLGEVRRTVAAFRTATGHEGEVYVRLQYTRGEGAIGLDPALAERPNWVLLVRALNPLRFAPGEPGWVLELAKTLRRNPPEALNPAWKTGNYLNNLLCLREARASGADEVLILNTRGYIAEAAVSNVAFVQNETVVTPRLDAGILAGVTRRILLHHVAPAASITMIERDVAPDELKEFTECFLTSTTRDLVGVRRIGGLAFQCGEDTITGRLKRAFEAYARQYASARADQRM